MGNAFIPKTYATRALASVAWLCLASHASTFAAFASPAPASNSLTQTLALSEGPLRPQIEESPAPVEAPLRQAFEGATTPNPDTDGQDQPAEERPAAKTPAAPAPATDGTATPATDAADAPAAEIIRDLSTLPEPVRQMRERLVEAAASGDIERLRPLIEGTPKPPQIMSNESDDPVDTLKNFSGDPDGQEILAIMLDVLSTGVARVDAGTPEETYVWPYFVGKQLSALTPPERVELLRIVTAGDLMGMEETGNYNFYRIGISPDGQWKFVAGGD
jgi:hypothetical protein